MGRRTRSVVVPFAVQNIANDSFYDSLLEGWNEQKYTQTKWLMFGEAVDCTQRGKTIYSNSVAAIPEPERGKIIEKMRRVDDEEDDAYSDEDYKNIEKEYPVVYIADESEFRDYSEITVWAYVREHLEQFCKDFNISEPIEDNVAVQQTL